MAGQTVILRGPSQREFAKLLIDRAAVEIADLTRKLDEANRQLDFAGFMQFGVRE